jgi:GR25 family glycosyltransferase involved in LPS biosynthesis
MTDKDLNIDHVKNIIGNTQVFWINLNRSPDRKIQMEQIFNSYDINNVRIEAIDGNNIDIEQYKKTYDINPTMSKYEIACACSHLKAIQIAYDKNLEYAVIMEDDINLNYFKYHTNTFKILLNELEKVNGSCLQLCLTNTKKEFAYVSTDANLLSKGWTNSGGAYLITKQGMKNVLDMMKLTKQLNVSEVIIFKNINNYMTKPYFSYCFLYEMKSTIRDNTKSAHATQTKSKWWWDEYYEKLELM